MSGCGCVGELVWVGWGVCGCVGVGELVSWCGWVWVGWCVSMAVQLVMIFISCILLFNVFFHSLKHLRQVKVYSLENYSVLHHLTYAAPITCVAMSVSAGRMHTCRIPLCACAHGNHHSEYVCMQYTRSHLCLLYHHKNCNMI